MNSMVSKYVSAAGIRTHYLEAGQGSPVVLLHSGEFGACGALSWERTIPALAEHFHVYAPDWLGFGKTEKLFSFEDMHAKRMRHMSAFLGELGIEDADFIGNSMGGTMLLEEAARNPASWGMRRAIVVSGGGHIPDNASRQLLSSYDGTLEYMQRLVKTLFVNPRIHTDQDYIQRRYELSRELGAWECTAAVRFKAPWREQKSSLNRTIDYSAVGVPVLLVAGRLDNLREAGYAEELQKQVPGAGLHVLDTAGHCPQIDEAEEFNRIIVDYLTRHRA